MVNPYPKLPRDTGQEAMQEYPSPKVALARYAPDNSSASSVISVSHDTTAIEVAAVTTPAVLRWVLATGDSSSVISIAGGTANFDHVIPVSGVRRFALPIETQVTNPQSVQGTNRLNGLYQRVAIKSIGVGSVLLTEF